MESKEQWFYPKAKNKIRVMWYRCPICGLLFTKAQSNTKFKQIHYDVYQKKEN